MNEETKDSRNIRIDVQVKLKKMMDMMQRPQGASVKEICSEIDCSSKSFYRHLDKLLQMDVPYETKPDPNGATNSVRYFLYKPPMKGSKVFLSSAEKALIRMMIQSTDPLFTKFNDHRESSDTLLEKLNDGIIHDTKTSEYKFISDEFTLDQKWEYDENFFSLANALDLKQSISFKTAGKGFTPYEEEFMEIDDQLLFQVYTILNKNGIFYAFGKVEQIAQLPENKKIPAEIRCIKIHNIKDVKFHRQYIYSIPEDFDFEKWYRIYFPESDEMQNYHIEVDKETLHTIMHASQYYPEVLYDWGGKTHLVYRTSKKKEFMKYLRTLGSGAKVVSPESFVREVQEDLRKTLALYNAPSVNKLYSEKDEVFAPAESFDRHSWETTLFVDYCSHWWRFDINEKKMLFHDILNYSLYLFKKDGLTEILSTVKYHYRYVSEYFSKIQKDDYDVFPYLHFYNGYIAMEIPFLEEIDETSNGAVEKFFYSYHHLPGKWSKSLVEQIITDLHKDEFLPYAETYAANGPLMLLTGINRINSDWAKQITETGKLFGFPTAAILFTGDGTVTGDMNISVHKYYKD